MTHVAATDPVAAFHAVDLVQLVLVGAGEEVRVLPYRGLARVVARAAELPLVDDLHPLLLPALGLRGRGTTTRGHRDAGDAH